MPIEDVADIFEAIVDLDVDVFKGVEIVEMQPTFPIEMGNFHQRVKNGLPKSNNAAEGFNSALNNHIINYHPLFVIM